MLKNTSVQLLLHNLDDVINIANKNQLNMKKYMLHINMLEYQLSVFVANELNKESSILINTTQNQLYENKNKQIIELEINTLKLMNNYFDILKKNPELYNLSNKILSTIVWKPIDQKLLNIYKTIGINEEIAILIITFTILLRETIVYS